MSEVIFKIYVLKHPDTLEIRYVGQTIQKLEHRLKRHINNDGTKCHKVNWIKSLKHKLPIIELIDQAYNKEDSDKLERELGFFRAAIGGVLKKQCKQAYGYIWEYE